MARRFDVFKKYISDARGIVIPNAVPQYKEIQTVLCKEKEWYSIINIARLDKHSPRQHLLIEAFAKLLQKYPQWRVELWGQTGIKNIRKN